MPPRPFLPLSLCCLCLCPEPSAHLPNHTSVEFLSLSLSPPFAAAGAVPQRYHRLDHRSVLLLTLPLVDVMSEDTRRRRRPLLCLKLRGALLSAPTSLLPLTSPPPPPPGTLPFLRYFNYKEIKRATDGFSRIIGSGSNGAIYKAQFPDGLVAVVKKVIAFEQGKDVFHRELQFLGCLHHRHLVKLQGFSEGRDRFLVFDYMENGSLKEFLHDPLRTPLNWRTRLQIAIDVAAALEYLYSFCDPPIYDVTISADNVMLDRNFVAKLSAFGLLMSSDGHQVPGSYGENLRDHVNQRNKRTLFQFGALILELVTGQSFGSEGEELMQWIQQSNFTYSMHKMVDSDLGSTYNSKELRSLLIMAKLCTRMGDEPVVSITQVFRYLQRKMSLE